MDFLTNLDLLLKSNNMKRADLARAIHVAPSTINSWYARGSEKVNLHVLKDIAEYFNVSLEVLVNGDTYAALCFTESDYTKEELELIANFGKMLKERRINKHD
jgi:transcriptional regulator with XRE-family HTH domain